MGWSEKSTFRICEDWHLNEAANSLIRHCLELLHKGKLKEFNQILKETVKQNDIVLRENTKKVRKPRKKKATKKK
jgi:hypothetical protein